MPLHPCIEEALNKPIPGHIGTPCFPGWHPQMPISWTFVERSWETRFRGFSTFVVSDRVLLNDRITFCPHAIPQELRRLANLHAKADPYRSYFRAETRNNIFRTYGYLFFTDSASRFPASVDSYARHVSTDILVGYAEIAVSDARNAADRRSSTKVC